MAESPPMATLISVRAMSGPGMPVTAGMIAPVAWIPASAMSRFLRPNRSADGPARIASAAPPGEAPDTRYP